MKLITLLFTALLLLPGISTAATCTSCQTAQAAASIPKNCLKGQAPTGVDKNFNALNCQTINTSTVTVTVSTTSLVTTTLAQSTAIDFQVPTRTFVSATQPDGQTRDGAYSLMSCRRRTTFGDNEACSEVLNRTYEDPNGINASGGPVGWFSHAFIGMPYGNIGSALFNNMGDQPSIVIYGPSQFTKPSTPTVTVIDCSVATNPGCDGRQGKFYQNWQWSFSTVRIATNFNGASFYSPPTIVTCPYANCGYTIVDNDATNFNPPWWGGGPVEEMIFIGAGYATTQPGVPPIVSYAWQLDRLYRPGYTLTVTDTNGELPTENQFDVSGPHLFESTDPITSWAPAFTPNATIYVGDSLVGPQLNPLTSLRIRYTVDGVHCDAACEQCAAARGAASALPATPPTTWPRTYKGFCVGDVRLRRTAVVGSNITLYAPSGRCAITLENQPGQPTACITGDGQIIPISPN